MQRCLSDLNASCQDRDQLHRDQDQNLRDRDRDHQKLVSRRLETETGLETLTSLIIFAVF